MTRTAIIESIGTCLALADTASTSKEDLAYTVKAEEWMATLNPPLTVGEDEMVNEIRRTKYREYTEANR